MRRCWSLPVLLLLCLATPRPAQAYLDPGSGSLIVQLILGGVAGLVVVLKLYWHKLRALLGFSKEKPEAD